MVLYRAEISHCVRDDKGDSQVDKGDSQVDKGDSQVDKGDSQVDELEITVPVNGFSFIILATFSRFFPLQMTTFKLRECASCEATGSKGVLAPGAR